METCKFSGVRLHMLKEFSLVVNEYTLANRIN